MLKKLLCTLLTILIITPAFGFFNSEKIFADGAYEVAYIEDNGNLKTVTTCSSFDSAIKKMKENEDYVVRHANSKSPSKIIAMNSGFAYTYPYRRGYSTMNIYEDIDSSLVGSGVTTYVSEHYEMTYHSTYYYHEAKGLGYIEVTLNGFHGYCDLEYTDLVPTKYVEKNLPITIGGGDITGSNEEAFSVKIKQNYYKVENKDGYKDLVFVYHRAWSKTSGGDCLEYSSTVGVAPDFMDVGKHYYSNDGINFYSDSKLTKKVGTYYNYYQFQPLRTKTNITASQMNSFLKQKCESNSVLLNEGQSFIDAQNNYGCNAATILAMAIHESGWGSSNIARGKNNLFGWGAFDDATSNATTYTSVEACVNAQMADNLANYMDVKCSRYFSMSLGNKGGGFVLKYASDPYWPEKISSFYYQLDKYAGGGNGKLVDYNAYDLAVVKTINAEVKASVDGVTMYTTANKTGYQKNLIVPVLGETGSYTVTYTSEPINDDGLIFPIELPYGTLVEYDWNKSYGFIKTKDLILLNNGTTNDVVSGENDEIKKPNIVVDPANLKGMISIDNISLSNNNDSITLSGVGLIKGMNFDLANGVKHELVFKDIADETNEHIYLLSTNNQNVDLNDGYIYDYVSYSGNVNLNDLPFGSYTMYLRVTNGEYSKECILRSSNTKHMNIVSNNEMYSMRLKTNKPRSYRFELEKYSTPINYKNVNKKKNTPSIFSYESISVDETNKLIHVVATAYMPGVNFDTKNNPEFNVYLVNNKDDYKKISTTIIESPMDYNALLKTSYSLSKVTYEFDINLSEISSNYYLVTEIKSTDGGKTYVDYVDMDNKANINLPSVVIDGIKYKLSESLAKTRTVLIAEEA